VTAVAHHRRPTPDRGNDLTPALWATVRRNALLMAVANTVTAFALWFGSPGASASLAFLAFLAPLPLWGFGFAAAAAFQVAGRALVGHSIGAPLWAMLATGAVYGLIAGTSSAPAATAILAGLTLYCAGHHVNAMGFRRRERQARRDA
jgi:hypothetical protein